MTDVKWIKIVTDIFDDDKMLLIETLPDADSIIVIWFKLLCLAGKQNNSGVFLLNDRIAYTDKMLATIFRRKESTVQLALKTFEEFGMIEIVDDVITIPNWGKYQTLDKLEKKTEYMRDYMRDYREKQKQIACKTNSKTNGKSNDKVNRKTNVSEADKDINRLTDIEINNNAERRREIIEYLNEKTGKNFKANSQSNIKLVEARLKEGHTVEDFKKVIDNKVAEWKDTDQDQYLRPETLFAPSHFESYLNQRKVKAKPKGNTLSDSMSHHYTDEEKAELRRRAKE